MNTNRRSFLTSAPALVALPAAAAPVVEMHENDVATIKPPKLQIPAPPKMVAHGTWARVDSINGDVFEYDGSAWVFRYNLGPTLRGTSVR